MSKFYRVSKNSNCSIRKVCQSHVIASTGNPGKKIGSRMMRKSVINIPSTMIDTKRTHACSTPRKVDPRDPWLIGLLFYIASHLLPIRAYPVFARLTCSNRLMRCLLNRAENGIRYLAAIPPLSSLRRFLRCMPHPNPLRTMLKLCFLLGEALILWRIFCLISALTETGLDKFSIFLKFFFFFYVLQSVQ